MTKADPVAPFTRLSPGVAWGRVVGMTGVLWLALGVAGFGVGTRWVYARHQDTVAGAFALDLAFLAGALAVVAVVGAWQRRLGETFVELGWGAPTRTRAVVAAVGFGLLWTALSYSRGGDPLAWSWQRPIMMVIGVVLALAEEVARAFVLTQLHRAGVPAWAQVVVGGVVMGSYHGLVGLHYSVTYAVSSVVMFAILSAIYVWGRRSLTPVVIGHSLPHVLGDPELTRMILTGLGHLGP